MKKLIDNTGVCHYCGTITNANNMYLGTNGAYVCSSDKCKVKYQKNPNTTMVEAIVMELHTMFKDVNKGFDDFFNIIDEILVEE